MLKVITINLNGIRAAGRKGFFDWLKKQDADVICLQETKAQMQHLKDALYRPQGYHAYFVDAEKKGYSGVGIYTRKKPTEIITTLGWETADREGRYLEIKLNGLSLVSLYLPSGTSGKMRQAIKYEFLNLYLPHLKNVIAQKKSMIICGDFNIAHKQIDLKNWRANQKHSGFLPEERSWLDTLFDEVGFIDGFRVINQSPDEYTWWSYRGRAREKNVGWRIDYQIMTPDLKNKIQAACVYRDQIFSDHAPLIMEYEFTI